MTKYTWNNEYHRIRGRRRRKLKLLIILSILCMVLFISTITIRDAIAIEPVDEPTVQDLAVARIQYRLNGYNGTARYYIERWPDYADYITREE